jgi:hypothetical protein
MANATGLALVTGAALNAGVGRMVKDDSAAVAKQGYDALKAVASHVISLWIGQRT